MRGLARWILLVAATALVLLGRPLDRLDLPQGNDDQAGSSESDDLELRAGRRSIPSLRMGDATTDEDARGFYLDQGYEGIVPAALVRDFAFAVAGRHAHRTEHAGLPSARGPPSSRA